MSMDNLLLTAIGLLLVLLNGFFVAAEFAVRERGERFELGIGGAHVRSSSLSRGLSCSSIASRARKMRERTVPIGQFISSAISS